MKSIRTRFIAVLVTALVLGAGSRAEAQVFTLPFMSPQPESSLGIYLNDFGDLALEGIARGNFGGFNMGIRGGIVDADDATGITIGGEFRNPLNVGTDPLDLAFTLGAQGLLGDFEGFGVQGGLTIGHTFVGDNNFRITPYVHPRIAFIDPGEPADGDLELLADVGFDLDFASRLSLRLGVNLGDGADWGIGLAWR